MNNITIGQVTTVLAFFVGLISSIEFLLIRIKKWLKSTLKEELEKVTNDINSLRENLKKIQVSNDQETMSRCKYDLVTLMSRIKEGYKPTTEEKQLLYEVKDLYNNKGGDSYVDNMFDDLKKEGKF